MDMNLVLTFQPGIMNAWILCIPFLVPAFIIGTVKKDVTRRMSDMSGYSARERFFTIAASLAPYPFMAGTVWIPFTSLKPFIYAGSVLYAIGMAAFYASIYSFAVTPPDKPLTAGVYRFSRNPMYVSASMVFSSICMMTANPVLIPYLVVLLVLQHFMILAEERICSKKFGPEFHEYIRKVPRYLIR